MIRSPAKAKPTANDVEARILEAATVLFARDGFASVKVPEIAATAKVGLNTLYDRYPSKEDLGNVVYRHCKNAWAEAVLTDWPAKADPKVQFLTYWERLSDFATRERNIALYNERQPLGQRHDKDSRALYEKLDEQATAILQNWSEASGLAPYTMKAIMSGTFQRLLELDVSDTERAKLMKEAGPALLAALFHK